MIFDTIHRRTGSPEAIERVRNLARAASEACETPADLADVQAIVGYCGSSKDRAADVQALLDVKSDSIAEDRASQPAAPIASAPVSGDASGSASSGSTSSGSTSTSASGTGGAAGNG